MCHPDYELPVLEVAMPGVGERSQGYGFGAFQLDPRSGELRKRGIKIKLQDQPSEILLLLLEHAGEVVTREQIQEHLWPGNTFVDFDHAINSAVRKLRDALGDSARTRDTSRHWRAGAIGS